MPLLQGYNGENSPDYAGSADEQLDQVYAQMTQAGLNSNDVWTLRLFLRELRKELKAGGNVLASVSLAIGTLVKQKQAYQDAHENGADQWPPHSKMPVRFGDPKQELGGLLLGRTHNATRFVEPNRKEYLKNNPPAEKG